MRRPVKTWLQLFRNFTGREQSASGTSTQQTPPLPDHHIERMPDVPGLQSATGQLEQRIRRLESDRDSLHEGIQRLHDLLEQALDGQERAGIHIRTLEARLGEQADRHEADLQAARLRERQRARRVSLAMTAAGVAFVVAISAAIIALLDSRRNAELLTGINRGVQDIRATMHDRRADIPAQADVQVHEPERSPVPSSTPAQPHAAELQLPAALPEPDFVVSGSLPLAGHNFASRQDVRAFFADNAQQPGVSTLPGGVQYRVLIPGDGRVPGPSDTVVVEYRAFRPDGSELDNSFRELQPSTLVVSEALPGLREALQHMRENAQWELYVPPSLINDAVRKRGRFGYEPLIYTVELLSVTGTQSPSREQ